VGQRLAGRPMTFWPSCESATREASHPAHRRRGRTVRLSGKGERRLRRWRLATVEIGWRLAWRWAREVSGAVSRSRNGSRHLAHSRRKAPKLEPLRCEPIASRLAQPIPPSPRRATVRGQLCNCSAVVPRLPGAGDSFPSHCCGPSTGSALCIPGRFCSFCSWSLLFSPP
jgi:hypothetical protein